VRGTLASLTTQRGRPPLSGPLAHSHPTSLHHLIPSGCPLASPTFFTWGGWSGCGTLASPPSGSAAGPTSYPLGGADLFLLHATLSLTPKSLDPPPHPAHWTSHLPHPALSPARPHAGHMDDLGRSGDTQAVGTQRRQPTSCDAHGTRCPLLPRGKCGRHFGSQPGSIVPFRRFLPSGPPRYSSIATANGARARESRPG